MDAFKIIVKDIPPSNNKYMGNGIGAMKNRVYQSEKKFWNELIGWTIISAGWRRAIDKPFKRAKVIIRYFFADKIRRDPDNYSGKFINDALVDAGILIDDDFEHIILDIGLGAYGVGKEAKRTEIEIVKI